MKTKLSIILLSIIFLFSCSNDDTESITSEGLQEMIDETNIEIQALVDNSTGTSTQDCRTRFIGGGNGCGPIITYGINGVDTLELEAKFNKLSDLKDELWEKQDVKEVCSIAFPDKDSLISGKCLSCYGNIESGFECF